MGGNLAKKRTSGSISRSNGKKNGKERALAASGPGTSPWPFIVLGVILIVIAGVLFFIDGRTSGETVNVQPQLAAAALEERGVSALIIPDLSDDMGSGEFTLDELNEKYPGFEADIAAVVEELSAAKRDIVATVNGEEITRETLETQMALLPPPYNELFTEEQVLEQIISEELLLQEAKRLGIAPTTEDIDAAYQDLLTRGQISEEELRQNLANFGLGVDELRTMLVRQLTISLLFNQTVDAAVAIPEEEIRAYYDENGDAFAIPNQVTVRHILVATGDTKDAATAKTEAEALVARLVNGADFCALVAEASDDMGSKETCGEYTFARGVMVPPFEEASFAMTKGETRIVETSFGQHVVEKLGETPAGTVPYETARGQIAGELANAKRLEAYQAKIAELRDAAEVVILLSADVPEEPDSAVPSEPSVPSEPAAETAPSEPVTTRVEIVQPEEPAASLAACLSEKGAVLYVAAWDPASREERNKFGDDASALTVIDCATTDDATCDDLLAFPAWKIGGDVTLGGLSFEVLAEKSGCN